MHSGTTRPKPTALPHALALLALLASLPLAAEETRDPAAAGFTQLYWQQGETSDDYRYRQLRLDFRNHRRAHFWPYQGGSEVAWDWGVTLAHHRGEVPESDFTANRAELMLGRGLSPQAYVEGRVGQHQLSVDARDGNEQLSSHLFTLRYSPRHWATLVAATERDFVYRQGLQPGGFTDALRGTEQRFALTLRPSERMRIAVSTDELELSDGNRRDEINVDAKYGISPGWPWVWAGLTGHRTRYDEDRDGYWSPEHFTSVGLAFESSFELNPAWDGSASLSVSRVRENRGKSGTGTYLSLGLDREFAGDLRLRLEYTHGSSIQSNSHWWGQNLTARLLAGWR